MTLGLAVLKKEEKTSNRDGLVSVYKTMWRVIKLKRALPASPVLVKSNANEQTQTSKPS